MTVFLDTSFLYAYMDGSDRDHPAAAGTMAALLENGTRLATSNYVLLETNALVQRRLGMPALRDFQRIFAPLLDCFWVDAEIHEAALTGLLAAGRHHLSLVDCASFQIMHRHGIDTAAAFDADFAREGFRVLPGK